MKLHDPSVAITDANEALAILKEGNQRFISNESYRFDYKAMREKTAKSQKPFAIIVTCADSRTCPEIIFDQGIGNIFVCRNAGNVADDDAMGSCEFAHAALGAQLVVVLGHTECGAVYNAFDKTSGLPEKLQNVLNGIGSHLGGAADKAGATTDNVKEMVRRFKSNPVFEKAKVVGAEYDIATGVVTWH